MADSGGHFLNLAEVAKLTPSQVLIGGIIDEAPKRGSLLTELGMRQSNGYSISWNRSNARFTASKLAIGGDIPFTDVSTYRQLSSTLKQFALGSYLNNFVRDIYGTVNDYEAIRTLELRTGVVETIENAFIYDNDEFDTTDIRGLHFWAETNGSDYGANTNLDAPANGALSLALIRTALDEMRYGVDFYLMPFLVARRIDAFYQEAGYVLANRSAIGQFVWMPGAQGLPIPVWAGTPIRRSDYMRTEGADTGQGADAKTFDTGATYTIFGIKRGVGAANDPGVNIGFGGEGRGNGEVFRVDAFDKVIGKDSGAVQLVSYLSLMCGSGMGLFRIDDITDAVVVA